MRRQTQPHGLAARWPLRPLEIDPAGLPVRYSLPVRHGLDHPRAAHDFLEIAPDAVTVVHEVSGFPAVRRRFRLRDFAGVAIRLQCMDDIAGGFAVSVNLHHPDPKLCFPLYMSDDMSTAGARWQSWARSLKLPLLLPSRDGGWREPFERLGKLRVNPPHRRPLRLGMAERRSNLSAVREMGDPGLVHAVGGREIIARS